MGRRQAGALLLLAVLCGAVILPNLDGRHVPGTGVAEVAADPLQVGDCLPVNVGTTPTTVPGQTLYTPPAGARTPCVGRVGGEVVSVGPAMAPMDWESYSLVIHQCRSAAELYLGMSNLTGLQSARYLSPQRWRSFLHFETVIVGPDKRQRDAGQRWSACVVVPTDRTGYSRRDEPADALATKPLPSVFAGCVPALEARSWLVVPCSRPHDVEVLGTEPEQPYGPTLDELSADCAGLASRLMGTADPTVDGQLVVEAVNLRQEPQRVVTDRYDPGVGAVLGPVAVDPILCTVRAVNDRQLDGTVVGTGGGPLPWSS